MKARDSQTETLKDVYVKALDSLPVGSEIDFDGDTSNIPAGWEQVNTQNILWSNPNPTTAVETLNITLNNSDYDELEIIYRFAVDGNVIMSQNTLKGYDCQLIGITGAGVVRRTLSRNSDTSYTLGTPIAPIGTTNNVYLVPQYIIGHKNNQLKKTSNNRPRTSQTLNVESNSTTDAYSCDYENKRNTYSTDETFTGKYWIDGKKIYRKVISPTSYPLPVNASSYSTGITDFGELISLTGVMHRQSGSSFTIPKTHHLDNGYAVNIQLANASTINLEIGSAFTNIDKAYFFIEYTKTTN